MAVYLATLGQRPEAITMAFDVLDKRFHYDTIGIIHTNPQRSQIKSAYEDLSAVLERDYPNQHIAYHELHHPNGDPLIDVADSADSDAYYTGMVNILRDYRINGQAVHLMISSGRKAMSVYATLAASLLFGERDHVWTVIASYDLMQRGMFHAPIGKQDQVHLVDMPLPISRLIPGEIARKSVNDLTQRISPRQKFLSLLTPSELQLAECLAQHPYTSNEQLAEILGKASKTVENQLGRMYPKLFDCFDLDIDDRYQRQVLIDVMAGRV